MSEIKPGMEVKHVVGAHGIEPVEFKVLVKPEVIEKKTAGGIILPDTVREKQRFAKETGFIKAFGSLAFTDPDWRDNVFSGTRVIYDRYSGVLIKGADGEEYRIIQDKDIIAVLHYDGPVS